MLARQDKTHNLLFIWHLIFAANNMSMNTVKSITQSSRITSRFEEQQVGHLQNVCKRQNY